MFKNMFKDNYSKRSGLEPVSRSPCALLKLDFLTNACYFCMHYSESPALVRCKGFVKPAPGVCLVARHN